MVLTPNNNVSCESAPEISPALTIVHASKVVSTCACAKKNGLQSECTHWKCPNNDSQTKCPEKTVTPDKPIESPAVTERIVTRNDCETRQTVNQTCYGDNNLLANHRIDAPNDSHMHVVICKSTACQPNVKQIVGNCDSNKQTLQNSDGYALKYTESKHRFAHLDKCLAVDDKCSDEYVKSSDEHGKYSEKHEKYSNEHGNYSDKHNYTTPNKHDKHSGNVGKCSSKNGAGAFTDIKTRKCESYVTALLAPSVSNFDAVANSTRLQAGQIVSGECACAKRNGLQTQCSYLVCPRKTENKIVERVISTSIYSPNDDQLSKYVHPPTENRKLSESSSQSQLTRRVSSKLPPKLKRSEKFMNVPKNDGKCDVTIGKNFTSIVQKPFDIAANHMHVILCKDDPSDKCRAVGTLENCLTNSQECLIAKCDLTTKPPENREKKTCGCCKNHSSASSVYSEN